MAAHRDTGVMEGISVLFTADAPAVDALDEWRAMQLLFGFGLVFLAVGGVILLSRRSASRPEEDSSVVRSWLAVALVLGLLTFAGLSFALTDSDTRSLLVGAIAASTGSAVAFYFSSKDSSNARRDILDVTFGTEKVPDLKDKTVGEATALLGGTSLALKYSDDATVGSRIDHQDPPKDTLVRKGTDVSVQVRK